MPADIPTAFNERDLTLEEKPEEESTLEFKMNRLIADIENGLISKTGRFDWSFAGLMNLCTETLDFVEQGHDIDLQHFSAWRKEIFKILDNHNEPNRKRQIAKVLNPLVMFHSNPEMRKNSDKTRSKKQQGMQGKCKMELLMS